LEVHLLLLLFAVLVSEQVSVVKASPVEFVRARADWFFKVTSGSISTARRVMAPDIPELIFT
jgi:hypothetical protein